MQRPLCISWKCLTGLLTDQCDSGMKLLKTDIHASIVKEGKLRPEIIQWPGTAQAGHDPRDKKSSQEAFLKLY